MFVPAKPRNPLSHSHDHAPARFDLAFGWGIGLNVVYVLAEAGFGFATNSLALLADAGHNLSDVLGLVIAWGAHRLARRPPRGRYTYGFRSSTILAALANAILLLVAVGAIVWEAVRRSALPAEVAGHVVTWVALVGVVINTATALLFLRGREHDVNVKGAFLHMAADAGVSVGVVLAGIGIAWTGATWIDPVTSLVVALVILVGTWSLFQESLGLALHAVPHGIDIEEVATFLADRPGVTAVHDLHVWAMSTTETALTAHVVRPDAADADGFLCETTDALHDRFEIVHATIQIETGTWACPHEDPDRV